MLVHVRGVFENVSRHHNWIAGLDAGFRRAAADTADNLPAFEVYLRRPRHLRTANDRPDVFYNVRETVDYMTHFASVFRGSTPLHACEVFVRRYSLRERRGVHAHFDRSAQVTAVLDVSAKHYEGGLFVGDALYDARPPHLVRTRPGDMVVHDANVLHGVNISSGTRHSLVVWMQDDEACDGPRASWYATDTLLDAYHMGSMFFGRFGEAMAVADGERRARAHAALLIAARAGLPRAQSMLGTLCMTQGDAVSASTWWHMACGTQRDACRNAGLLHETLDYEYAQELYSRAAGMGDVRAARWLDAS